MEGRDGARRLTQRSLDGDPARAGPADEEMPREPETPSAGSNPPEPPTDPVPPLRGPSDLELRKRQRAWFLERARFEAAMRSEPTDGDPK